MAIITSSPGSLVAMPVLATPGDWWLKDSSNLIYGLSFDGIDDRVDIGDVLQFEGWVPYTLECWVCPYVINATHTLLSKSGTFAGSEQGQALAITSTGALQANRNSPTIGTGTNQSLTTSAGLIVAGRWTHCANVYDGTTMSIKIMGVTVASVANSRYISDTTQPWRFGRHAGSAINLLKGAMAEVRFWDYARTDLETQDAMYSRLEGIESGLVGYWPMDEGSGTLVLDKSGGGSHGAIVGPLWTQDVPPVLGMPVNILVPALSTSETEVQNVYSALGRTNKIVVSDVIQGEEFELDMEFYGKEDFERFNIMRRGQRPLLLQAYNGEQWFIRLGADRNVDRQMSYDPSVYRVKVTAYQQPIPTS